MVTFTPRPMDAVREPVTVPASRKHILFAFSKVTEVVLSEGIEALGSCAFLHCRRLKRIVLPSTLKRIGAGAFYGCTALESVVIPDGVTFEADARGNYRTFARCEGLHTAVLPADLEQIPPELFARCGSLRLVQLPRGLKGIGERAFHKCGSLKILDLPETARDIHPTAFSRCPAGGWIYGGVPKPCRDPVGVVACVDGTLHELPEHPHIAWVPVAGQSRIALRGGTLRAILPGDLAFLDTLEELVIPDGVEVIGPHAFEGCGKLRSVTLPDSLRYIGCQAFGGCVSLQQISVPEGVWIQQDPFDRTCRKTSRRGFPPEAAAIAPPRVASSLQGFRITGGTLTKYTGADSHITLPEGITRIESFAFARCGSLESVAVPEGVTEIGEGAFRHCAGLTQVSLPSTVRSIGSFAFSSPRLRKIRCAGVVPDCSGEVFSTEDAEYLPEWVKDKEGLWLCRRDVPDIEPVPGVDYPSPYIPEGNPDLYDRRDLARWANEGLRWEWEQSHKSASHPDFQIQNGILRKYTGGQSHVSVPKGVRRIGEGAFLGCKTLKSVHLPEGVIRIGDNAFRACGQLEEVRLPGTLGAIGHFAFDDCYKLKKLRCPAKTLRCSEVVFGIENLCVCLRSGGDLLLEKHPDDEGFTWPSYEDMHPYPLDPRARAIVEERNRKRYSGTHGYIRC